MPIDPVTGKVIVAGVGAAMGGVGMGVQARRTKRQNEQEEKLMDLLA